MRPLLLTLLFILALATAQAVVVRLAPDFSFPGAGNKMETLKSLRGQPVVLIIAKSPKSKEVKVQAKYLREIYQQFANKQVVFVAAFTSEPGQVPSDVPFVIANNGPAVASAYGVLEKPGHGGSFVSNLMNQVAGGQNEFSIVIIGKDGNIDYQTNKVLPPERVRDVIQNSYTVQVASGRQ